MDNLERFLELREALQTEQAEILRRLQEIEKALGASSSSELAEEEQSATKARRQGRRAGTLRVSTPFKSARNIVPTKGVKGRRNKTSLKEVVLEVLGSGRKTRQEILEAVQESGYQFTTSNPLNSLGVILYGKKPKFRNDKGYFSVA